MSVRSFAFGVALAAASPAFADAPLACPASLADGARLTLFSVFEVVGAQEIVLAPEVDGDALEWFVPPTPGAGARATCAYSNGMAARLDAPDGVGLSCRATWDAAAGGYGAPPTCGPIAP